MKKTALLFFLLAGFSLLFSADTLRGTVVKIVDGDTVDLLVQQGEKPIRIRLYGVDAPEHDQPFGKRSKIFAADFSGMKEAEVVVRDTDRYGRIVGEVWVDHLSLNRELVRNGYAWWYKQYAKNDSLLEHLELEARAEKRGLWSDPQSKEPWKWRAEKKKLSKRALKKNAAKEGATSSSGATQR